MTSKSDIYKAGLDSFNSNTSGNPDIDRDIGIVQPSEITEVVDLAGKISKRCIEGSKNRHPSGYEETEKPAERGFEPSHEAIKSLSPEAKVVALSGIKKAKARLPK